MFQRIFIQLIRNAYAVTTALFVLVWCTAWALNALRGTHFDLAALQGMYLTVIIPVIGKHTVNSVWNSPRGAPPSPQTQKTGATAGDINACDKNIVGQK